MLEGRLVEIIKTLEIPFDAALKTHYHRETKIKFLQLQAFRQTNSLRIRKPARLEDKCLQSKRKVSMFKTIREKYLEVSSCTERTFFRFRHVTEDIYLLSVRAALFTYFQIKEVSI